MRATGVECSKQTPGSNFAKKSGDARYGKKKKESESWKEIMADVETLQEKGKSNEKQLWINIWI